MTKVELLNMLADEYKKTVRLPDDISLRDYKEAIERATGLKMSDKRAIRALDELDGFTSLLVVDRGKVMRVWREDVKARNTHQSKPKRVRRVSKKNRRSAVASSVSV